MTVLGLDHVQLACPAGSEDALRGFYGGLLGMEEIPKPRALAARGGAWFRAGAAEVHLGVEDGFRPARKAHPCLTVQDVDAVAARLATADYPVRRDDAVPGQRRFHTQDSVGNRVEICALPEAR